MALHVGFKDWPADKEQPREALQADGRTLAGAFTSRMVGEGEFRDESEGDGFGRLDDATYATACALGPLGASDFGAGGFRGHVMALVRVGRSWRSPYIHRGHGDSGFGGDGGAQGDGPGKAEPPGVPLGELKRSACLLRPAARLTEVRCVLRLRRPLPLVASRPKTGGLRDLAPAPEPG